MHVQRYISFLKMSFKFTISRSSFLDCFLIEITPVWGFVHYQLSLINLFSTQYSLFLFFKFIYLWLRWVFVAARRLSLVAVSGGYSSLRCTGFSLRWLLVSEHGLQSRRLQQLWHAGSVVVAHGLSCSAACGIFPDQGLNPCPALAGGFLTTAPPGKSTQYSLNECFPKVVSVNIKLW